MCMTGHSVLKNKKSKILSFSCIKMIKGSWVNYKKMSLTKNTKVTFETPSLSLSRWWKSPNLSVLGSKKLQGSHQSRVLKNFVPKKRCSDSALWDGRQNLSWSVRRSETYFGVSSECVNNKILKSILKWIANRKLMNGNKESFVPSSFFWILLKNTEDISNSCAIFKQCKSIQWGWIGPCGGSVSGAACVTLWLKQTAGVNWKTGQHQCPMTFGD